MDDNENSSCDVGVPATGLQPAADKSTSCDTSRPSPEFLLFATPPPPPERNNLLTRETETNYALSKIRSLTAGIASDQLSETVNRAIERITTIDADGFLFAGDPCTLSGEVPADPNRPLCLIWIPGLGKQLLESIPHWVHVASSRLSQKLDQETDWFDAIRTCLLYTSPSPRDLSTSRMPSSA